MPNYVLNKLDFKGNADYISNLRKEISSEGSCIDFDKIVPMPKDLKLEGVSYGAEQAAKAYIAKGSPKNLEKFLQAELESMGTGQYSKDNKYLLEAKKLVSNYKSHGFFSWYDWSCENWGTKWNASDTSENSPKTIWFQTAWSTPYKVIEALSKQYPEVEITLTYATEDHGSHQGIITFKDGKVLKNEEKDAKFAKKLWKVDN